MTTQLNVYTVTTAGTNPLRMMTEVIAETPEQAKERWIAGYIGKREVIKVTFSRVYETAKS